MLRWRIGAQKHLFTCVPHLELLIFNKIVITVEKKVGIKYLKDAEMMITISFQNMLPIQLERVTNEKVDRKHYNFNRM